MFKGKAVKRVWFHVVVALRRTVVPTADIALHLDCLLTIARARQCTYHTQPPGIQFFILAIYDSEEARQFKSKSGVPFLSRALQKPG